MAGSVQYYEQHKTKIEATQEVHLEQFSKKVNNSVEKISKSMKRLEMPDNTESMLGGIMTVVKLMRDNPNNPPPKHIFWLSSSNGMETSSSKLEVDHTNWLSTLTMPVNDVIRKNVAGHLRKKNGINVTSSSWRANAYMKKQKPIRRKVESRKLLIPSLANCVDFSEYGTNTNNKPPSKPALETIHLPVIHKHKPRSLSPIPEQITDLYHTSWRNTVIDNHTRILGYRVP
ncbi:uncharacterized protein [Dysidea avara]|uniref:uncharacterized protein n=1 Tax=Dysidea avara TaxID=196820 RepID=UPI00332B90D1